MDYAMKAYPESFADINFNQTYEDYTEELYGIRLSPKPGRV